MLIKRYAIVITYNDGMVYLHGIYIHIYTYTRYIK